MRILLGVSAGIAAYKAIHVLRLLQAEGHQVEVIPTPASLQFVGAATWEALAGHPVHTSVWEGATGTEHVASGRSADAVLVAPATADFLARYASGQADDLLTATLLMVGGPVVVAPAMHTEMWQHPATVHNVEVLKARGVHILEPAHGPLAGRDVGAGRLPEPEDLVSGLLQIVKNSAPKSVDQDLAGLRILISAGGTQEPLDPVRFLGNRSSGRQGIELARAASLRGAHVQLVAANVEAELKRGIGDEQFSVQTAAQLQDVMAEQSPLADVVIMAAAVADYRPVAASESKLKKTGVAPTIELVENPDILAGLAQHKQPDQTIVGFAAETGEYEEVLAHGVAKAQRKGADLLAINQVGPNSGFGDVPNHITVVNSRGEVLAQAQGSKAEVAHGLLDAIAAIRN